MRHKKLNKPTRPTKIAQHASPRKDHGPVEGLPEGVRHVDDLSVLVTEDLAKQLLGWVVDTTHVKTGFLFNDTGDAKLGKVWCTKNTKNRWIDMGCTYKYAQDQLLKRWRKNGEPIILGETGEVVSGQKRLVGLVVANALLKANPARYGHLWPGGEVTFESVIIGGVSEDHDTIRTIDNVQPRTLADIIYTELKAFAERSPSERRTLTKMTENAMKCLWYRMGVKDAFVEYMTHSEAVDFLKRHKKVFDAVEHIYDEDHDKSIGNYIPVGYASGLMYLFAASDTAADDYFALEPHDRTEKQVNFDQWDKAAEFFTLLSEGIDFMPIRHAITELYDVDEGGGGRLSEKETILIKAWNHFKANHKELVDDPPIKYMKRNDVVQLDEWPVAGGIDIGKPEKKRGKKKAASEPEVNHEELTNGKKAEKARKDSAIVFMTNLQAVRDEHKGKVLLWEDGDRYTVWADDAELAAEEFGLEFAHKKAEYGDLKRTSFKLVDLAMNVEQLQRAGKRVAIVTGEPGAVKDVRDLEPPASVSGKKVGISPVRNPAPVVSTPTVGKVKPVKSKLALKGGTN